MQITESLIVGYNINAGSDGDTSVLIVGKKTKGEVVNVINAFQGQEAIDIWEKLVGMKKGSDE